MAISLCSHQQEPGSVETTTMKLPQHELLHRSSSPHPHPKAALVDQIFHMHPNNLMEILLLSQDSGIPSSRRISFQKPTGYYRRHSVFSIDNHHHLYETEIVAAVRSCNLGRLQQLLDQHGPCVFFGANKNGETLLHLACRRADLPTLQFLVEDVGLNVHATDALGRTILHDIMWRPRMQLRLVEYLLLDQQQQHLLSPLVLLAKDARGHTPLDYCRSSDWPRWNKFWIQHRALLRKQVVAATSTTIF